MTLPETLMAAEEKINPALTDEARKGSRSVVGNISIPARPSVDSRQSFKGVASPAASSPVAANLRMGQGEGAASYTKNSGGQANVNAVLKPVLGEAISRLVDLPAEGPIRVADLGCSVGANALGFADYITKCVQEKCKSQARPAPEVQYFFSDLPSNDFNTLSLQLPALFKPVDGDVAETTADPTDQSSSSRSYFAAAVPGSFYDRLFPRASLHIVISTWSMHWISQIPASVMDATSPAYNKDRVWIDGGSPVVAEEYSKVSKADLLAFFTNRGIEMASGGLLFVMFLSRKDPDRKEVQFGAQMCQASPMSGLFELAWEDLVAEGLVDRATRDSFNMPVYFPSRAEVEAAVEATGAFHIEKLEIWQDIDFMPRAEVTKLVAAPEVYGVAAMNMMKTLMMSLVEVHVGPATAALLWDRLQKHAVAHCKRTRSVFCGNMPGGNVVLAVLVKK